MNIIYEKISEDYDYQMPKSKKLFWEASICKSQILSEFVCEQQFEYYKISQSIKRVKRRIFTLH